MPRSCCSGPWLVDSARSRSGALARGLGSIADPGLASLLVRLIRQHAGVVIDTERAGYSYDVDVPAMLFQLHDGTFTPYLLSGMGQIFCPGWGRRVDVRFQTGGGLGGAGPGSHRRHRQLGRPIACRAPRPREMPNAAVRTASPRRRGCAPCSGSRTPSAATAVSSSPKIGAATATMTSCSWRR